MRLLPVLVKPWAMLLASLTVLLCAPQAWADARLQLRLSANRLTVDEELQVTISANGDFDAITELQSDGFDFRNAGHQTQVSIINGVMQRIENFTFVGTALRPGSYRLGPIEARLGGTVVGKSNQAEVTVVGPQEAAGPSQPADQVTDLRAYAGQQVFVRPVLSATHPFAGQQIVVAWELYWAQNLQLQGVRETAAPKLAEFDPQELLKDHPKAEPVRIGGRHYMRQLTHRVLISAARPGTWRLEGPAYRVEVGDFFETKAAKVAAAPVELIVRPLPTADRPSSMDSASIGSLKMTATLQSGGRAALTHKVLAGERLLLQIDVEGTGNLLGLKAIEPPAVQGMTVEPLPGRAGDGVKTTTTGTEGKRSWQYVVSFARPGTYEVPVIEWTSFDPTIERYVTSRAGPFAIEAEGSAAPTAASGAAPAAVAEAARAESAPPGPVPSPAAKAHTKRGPPRPIAATADLASLPRAPWYNADLIAGLAALPWLLGLGVWLAGRWRKRRSQLAPTLARAAAPARAKQRLDAAARMEPTQGYAEAHRAIAQLLEDLAGLQLAGLTDVQLRHRLMELQVPEAQVRAIADELQHCEYARYAPGTDRATELTATCERLTKLVDGLGTALGGTTAGRSRTAAAVGALLLALTGLTLDARPAAAVSVEAGFAAANQAYLSGDWKGAIVGYQAILDLGSQAPAVHYNLGNALFQAGKLGAAVAHYKQALMLTPDSVLGADIEANLAAVRADLAEQSRRQHQTLHVFDESPEADVALARAAPRPLLAVLAVLLGLVALGLLLTRQRRPSNWLLGAGAAIAATGQVVALAWWLYARSVDVSVVQAIVLQEDASLSPCQGIGETMGLPEGLEVRYVRELADGRVEVRLTNGRQGCMVPAALQVLR